MTMVIRPIEPNDIESLYELAASVGVGMNSLPADKEFLSGKIHRADESFHQNIAKEQASYLFVLVDTTDNKAIGVCGIEASIGWDEPWFTYRISPVVHACNDIDVYTKTPTLFLSNDQVGYSELCSLLLHPNHRHNRNGALLSRCRFMFIQQFRELFGHKLFAEMRGFNDQEGRSPFWDHLGKKFFNMEFERIDFLTGRGQRSIIAELMPKYPVYTHLLPEAARECIGKVHPNTQPALEMLKQEGLRFENYIAVFDGGPVVESTIDDLRLIKESQSLVAIVKNNLPEQEQILIISNQSLTNFRCVITKNYRIEENNLQVTHSVFESLIGCSGNQDQPLTLNFAPLYGPRESR